MNGCLIGGLIFAGGSSVLLTVLIVAVRKING